jgi:hypothetical protein
MPTPAQLDVRKDKKTGNVGYIFEDVDIFSIPAQFTEADLFVKVSRG